MNDTTIAPIAKNRIAMNNENCEKTIDSPIVRTCSAADVKPRPTRSQKNNRNNVEATLQEKLTIIEPVWNLLRKRSLNAKKVSVIASQHLTLFED